MLIEIVDRPIDAAALVAAVRTDACGAVVIFLGVVRESSAEDPRRVERIVYEAYPTLALAQLRAIAEDARARFGPLEVAVVHRTGELGLGEASIAIAVASPHRAAAFDACEFVIDETKKQAAVWKQEVFADGGAAWRANAH